MIPEAAVRATRVRLVPDAEYEPCLLRLIRYARDRVWCSMFVVELNPKLDRENRVPRVLRELAAARWRGVDVMLVLGGSRENLLIAETTAAAASIAHGLGIPVRTLGRAGQRGSHLKLVVADEAVLTGSHNWSIGAFATHVQDSVCVESRDLAAYASNIILEQWRHALVESSP